MDTQELEYERTTIQLTPRHMRKLDRLRKRWGGLSRSAMLGLLIEKEPEPKEDSEQD